MDYLSPPFPFINYMDKDNKGLTDPWGSLAFWNEVAKELEKSDGKASDGKG